MRIIDEEDLEVTNPDRALGYSYPDQLFVAHHKASEGTPEEGHYEVIAEYPNGGKDVEWVVDVPGVPAKDAWDEYEDIQRWHWFTEEEIALANKPSTEERIAALEAQNEQLLEALLEMSMELYKE